MNSKNLWADGYQEIDGTWTAIVGKVDDKGNTIELERREGRKTQYGSETSLEAMWRKWSKNDTLTNPKLSG